MQIFFDDLALPRMMRTQIAEAPELKSHRAGYSNAGTPSNLSVIRSMRGAIMLQQIIDRRLAGKNKSIGNRERFLRRYQGQVRDAVRRAVDQRGIRDIEQGEDIHLPKRDISEPSFRPWQRRRARDGAPGQPRIRARRPHRAAAGRLRATAAASGEAGDSGEGEDDFVFHLTKEEFMQIFFDDLALPRMTRTQLAETPEMKSHRAGYSNSGTPSNLSVIRSMRGAIGRRVAIGAGSRAELAALEAARRAARRGRSTPARARARSELEAQIAALARAARPHPLPRPDRPALSQPRARCRSRPPRR